MMKKFYFLSLLLGMMFAVTVFTACGDDDDDDNNNPVIPHVEVKTLVGQWKGYIPASDPDHLAKRYSLCTVGIIIYNGEPVPVTVGALGQVWVLADKEDVRQALKHTDIMKMIEKNMPKEFKSLKDLEDLKDLKDLKDPEDIKKLKELKDLILGFTL